VSLRSEFHVVMSVTISALKRCSVRLYLQLFIGGLMPYLRCLRLLAYIGAQHTLFCDDKLNQWFVLHDPSYYVI
jgi:hypothetical protein